MHTETLHSHHSDTTATFGFWIYLMTDCVLFATLFATYAVLHTSTFGGPPGRELFSLPNVLVETLLLLTSSFTCGLAMLAAERGNKQQVLAWFAVTLLLGLSFLSLELQEFSHLIAEGNSFQRSAFLSSFFALVGTHGLHIVAGSLTLLVLMAEIWFRGITAPILRKLSCFSLFWHFLDLIWIFIFTIVYLMGVAS
jgi:cytochrome o ubiquinol oxidase subunit 3